MKRVLSLVLSISLILSLLTIVPVSAVTSDASADELTYTTVMSTDFTNASNSTSYAYSDGGVALSKRYMCSASIVDAGVADALKSTTYYGETTTKTGNVISLVRGSTQENAQSLVSMSLANTTATKCDKIKVSFDAIFTDADGVDPKGDRILLGLSSGVNHNFAISFYNIYDAGTSGKLSLSRLDSTGTVNSTNVSKYSGNGINTTTWNKYTFYLDKVNDKYYFYINNDIIVDGGTLPETFDTFNWNVTRGSGFYMDNIEVGVAETSQYEYPTTGSTVYTEVTDVDFSTTEGYTSSATVTAPVAHNGAHGNALKLALGQSVSVPLSSAVASKKAIASYDIYIEGEACSVSQYADVIRYRLYNGSTEIQTSAPDNVNRINITKKTGPVSGSGTSFSHGYWYNVRNVIDLSAATPVISNVYVGDTVTNSNITLNGNTFDKITIVYDNSLTKCSHETYVYVDNIKVYTYESTPVVSSVTYGASDATFLSGQMVSTGSTVKINFAEAITGNAVVKNAAGAVVNASVLSADGKTITVDSTGLANGHYTVSLGTDIALASDATATLKTPVTYEMFVTNSSSYKMNTLEDGVKDLFNWTASVETDEATGNKYGTMASNAQLWPGLTSYKWRSTQGGDLVSGKEQMHLTAKIRYTSLADGSDMKLNLGVPDGTSYKSYGQQQIAVIRNSRAIMYELNGYGTQTSQMPLLPDEWHRLDMYIDFANGTFRTYVDNVLFNDLVSNTLDGMLANSTYLRAFVIPTNMQVDNVGFAQYAAGVDMGEPYGANSASYTFDGMTDTEKEVFTTTSQKVTTALENGALSVTSTDDSGYLQYNLQRAAAYRKYSGTADISGGAALNNDARYLKVSMDFTPKTAKYARVKLVAYDNTGLATTNATKNVDLFTLLTDSKIHGHYDTQNAVPVTLNETYTIDTIIDMHEGTRETYVDGKLLATDIASQGKNFETHGMFRFMRIDSANGASYSIDNFSYIVYSSTDDIAAVRTAINTVPLSGIERTYINGVSGSTFTPGEAITARYEWAATDNADFANPVVYIAQYTEEGKMIKMSSTTAEDAAVVASDAIFNGTQATYEPADVAGSYIKVFFWNGETFAPYTTIEEIPTFTYDAEEDLSVLFCYPNGTRKAITLGFDDGNITADAQVIALLRENGMKATFNLIGNNNYSDTETFYNTYKGMELATHSQTHFGEDIHTTENITNIQNDIDNGINSVNSVIAAVKTTYNYTFPTLRGFVWPNHEPSTASGIRDTMKTWLDSHTSICYARGSYWDSSLNYSKKASGDYSLPTLENDDTWTRWCPNTSMLRIGGGTDDASDKDEIDRFFNNTEVGDSKIYPILLYTWGHSAEVVNSSNTLNYNNFNRILAEFAEHNSEVWSATQGEIYDYTNALKNVTVTQNADGTTTLKNNGTMVVYYRVAGSSTLRAISPNETVTF